MKKPEDYNICFHPDGTERENPYGNDDLDASIEWAKRLYEIKESFMSGEERLNYRKKVENMKDRMDSETGS